jgi:hypothetical protein
MSKDEIQKVTLGTNEALRVTADGEFIWHPEADAMIEYGDFTSSPAMRHILRALRKALAAPVQEPFGYLEIEDIESHSEYPHNCRSVSLWHEGGEGMVAIYTTPPAAPDLQAELDATNRQVEILSDALAESQREVAALKAVQEPVAIYQYQLANGSWIDQDKFSYDYNVRLDQATVRIVYTTPPAAQRQHLTDGSLCWCEPETSYTDPETGASVVVHKGPQ